MEKTIEIPEGYEARIEGNKVILERKESEDERTRKGLIYHLEELRAWKVGTLSPIRLSADYDVWIAYLEREKEQQSAEWGEEDERMLTSIIERGSSQVPFGEPALREDQMEWLMNMLKFHRPQPKVEWSEEDEKMFNSLCTVLRGGLSSIPTEQYIYWLESLRPSWKPSREQLLALKEQTSWLSKPNPLHSLYHQLCEL